MAEGDQILSTHRGHGHVIVHTNGIVGGGLTIATGIGLACRLQFKRCAMWVHGWPSFRARWLPSSAI